MDVKSAFLYEKIEEETKQAEFEKFKAFNDRTVDYEKLEHKLNEALGQLAHKDTVIREGLKTKAYELSVVKEKHDELMKQSLLTKSHYEGLVKKKTKVITDLKLKEEHKIEKMLSMEKQLKFLNEVVYKRSQSIQTIHMMTPKVSTYNGRPTFANPKYLKQAQSEIPCLYAFPYDQNTHTNRLIPDGEETLALERESQSKLNKDSSDSLKFFHELKKEMHADLKYVESLEKEIDELESDKAEFSDMYDEILKECVSKDVMCSYLQSLSDLDVLAELQCMCLHKVKECDCLAQRLSKQTGSVSKKVYTELLQRFAKVEKHSISLELALQKCKEQVKSDTVCNEKALNGFQKEREQYFKIQELKAKLQDKNIAISELKKLIEKGKGKSMDTKFDRPSILRQPNAQRIPKPSVLGKPTPFSDSLERRYFPKTRSVLKTNVSEGLSKPVTAQTLPQTTRQAVSNTNVLKPRMYRIDNRAAHTRAPQLPQTVRNTNHRIIQLILFIVDSGCTKHMTGNLKLLCNFVKKFLGTVRFGKDQFAPILGYGDLVAFRKSTGFVRDLQGNVLLTGNRGFDLYTISLQESTSSTPLCLMAKATPTQAWLWHRRLSHLNFDYINLLSKKDIVIGSKEKLIQVKGCSKFKRKAKFASHRLIWSNAGCYHKWKEIHFDADVPSQQELDLLFGPLNDEFFNAEEGEQLQDDKFTNPFCAPIKEVAESSSHNIGNKNVPTFNQPQVFEYRRTRYHPLEQVHGNPSMPVQTRRQLTTDPEMYIYALTVSTAELKNIKEAMADSAWIEEIQQHQ
nr:integrase, catalytic region, zinc finger, CCHC-type, peptidase aspartic, catalytic [Tanacetum cinerariifolium]